LFAVVAKSERVAQVEAAFDEWDDVLRASAGRTVTVANELLVEPGRTGVDQIVAHAWP
jgi:hypothetical protein